MWIRRNRLLLVITDDSWRWLTWKELSFVSRALGHQVTEGKSSSSWAAVTEEVWERQVASSCHIVDSLSYLPTVWVWWNVLTVRSESHRSLNQTAVTQRTVTSSAFPATRWEVERRWSEETGGKKRPTWNRRSDDEEEKIWRSKVRFTAGLSLTPPYWLFLLSASWMAPECFITTLHPSQNKPSSSETNFMCVFHGVILYICKWPQQNRWH